MKRPIDRRITLTLIIVVLSNLITGAASAATDSGIPANQTLHARTEAHRYEGRGLFVPTRAKQSGPESQPDQIDAELGAVRVKTTVRGMYTLTYAALQAAGVPVGSINPASFLVTYLGQPVRIQVTGDADATFESNEAVLFFAEPYLGRYMPYNVYRFSWGSSAAAASTRMVTRTVAKASQPVVASVPQKSRTEFDRVYTFPPTYLGTNKTALLQTGYDHFFDNMMNPTTVVPGGVTSVVQTYDVLVDDPILSANQTATITARVYNVRSQAANPDASFELKLNSTVLGTFQWEGEGIYTATTTVAANKLSAGSNQVVLTAALSQLSGVTDYRILPDWVEVSYSALPDAEGDRIYIRGIDTAGTSAEVPVTGFTSNAVRVYDVRDPRQPVELLGKQATLQGSTYEVRFWDAWSAGAPAAQYWLSTDAALLAPQAVELDAPSTWKGSGVNADYIALVHRDLWDAVQPLLDLRAGQGLRVAKVDVADVYDEFGYGRLDPEAIRSFLSYAYHNWNQGGPRPQYVVLVGDGHYDFKGVTGTAQKMYIPPYFTNSDSWINETPADDRYASVDGAADQLADMAIGRIPANSAADVTNVYNKIVAYENPAVATSGDWQKRVVFSADNDGDPNGNFHAISDAVRLGVLPAAYEDRTAYYDPSSPYSLPNPMTTAAAVKNGLVAAFNDSSILVQWFGHGSVVRWGSVTGIFNVLDPAALQPNTKLPFSQTYGCLGGYFVNLTVAGGTTQGMGETLVLTPGRGSIADVSPSGLQVSSDLQALNTGLIDAIFVDRVAEVGKAVQAAKLYVSQLAGGAYHPMLDSTILFGDPAVKLRLATGTAVSPTDTSNSREAGGAIRLSWPHSVPNTSYQVLRSEQPYFIRAQGAVVGNVSSSGLAAGTPLNLLDTGSTPPPAVTLTGYPARNYYWLVCGESGGEYACPTKHIGEFEFGLTTGN